MRTIRTKVYKFEELSEEAKQVAIETERNSKETDLWFFNDDAVERIKEAGFIDNVKLQYSLSYSQGDGLSFGCDNIENSVLVSFFAEILGAGKEKTAQVLIDNCSFECAGNRGNYYSYASRIDISYELDTYKENVEVIVSKVEEKIKDLYMQLCKDLEKDGYAQIEYQYTDECIIEDLVSNEVEFLISGKIF